MIKKVTKYTTETFINKAIEVYGNIYKYGYVDYKKSHTKVKIFCDLHGIFEQTPSSHLSGQGCRKCADARSSKSRAGNSKSFIKQAKEIHGDLYNYDEVLYVNNHTKVKLICKYHNEFFVKPNHHIQSEVGCKLCANVNRIQPRRKTLESYIADANEVHNNFYDYSLIKSYKSGKDMLEIICPKHGAFIQKAENHTNSKRGCHVCGYIKSSNSNTKSQEEFIAECISIHSDTYDYSNTIYKKDQKILDFGYNLIIIWEYDWNIMNGKKNYKKCKIDENISELI